MVSSSNFLFARALLAVAVLAAHQGRSPLRMVAAQTTCFAANGNAALKSAVNDYIRNGGNASNAGRTYGAVIGNWCVSRVTSFAQVFMGQTTFNQPLTNWNTSSATSFAQMFMNATAFNQPLANFDTRRATSMDRMFYMARSFTGQGLTNWQTSRVTNFYFMFRNSSMNANISSWNMASATDLREAFRFSPFNNNLCLWGNTMNSSKLPSNRMTNMFASTNCPIKTSPSFVDSPTGPLCQACPAWRWGTTCFAADGVDLFDAVNTYINVVQPLTTNRAKLAHSLSVQYGYPIATWCTKNVQNFNYLFSWQPSFNEPLTYWNTSAATDMSYMFWEARAFDQNLSHFDVSRVTVANHMFKYATVFRGAGLERWNVARIEQFYMMFDNAWVFNADISGWDVRRGMSFRKMFESAVAFNQNLALWKPQMAVDTSLMFKFASSFNRNLCSWGQYITINTDVTEMFFESNCQYQTPPLFDWVPGGPFCFDCPRADSLPTITEGPFELPLVPAAVTQRPDNTIVAWAGDRTFEFDYPPENGTDGTYTSTFNPDTKATTLLRVEHTNHRMFCPGTATLADGRLLITGGLSGPKSTFYDPYTDTWSSGPDMNIGRGYQSQVTLSSGMVFVLGGSWAPYSGVGGKSGEVYDPATNTWTVKPGIPASGTINTEDIQGEYRSDNHMWFFEAANGKILHAGPSKYMHWIDLAGDGSVVEAGSRGDDLDSMAGACALYDIEKFFSAGGATQYDVDYTPASNRAYTVDFSTNTPVVTRQPNMRFPRTLVTAVVLPDGNIVVLGGLTSVRLFSDENAVFHIEMFNPYTQAWSYFRSTLTTPRPYHAVSLLLKDARVLVGGGGLCGAGCEYTTSWNHPNVEIITPPYLVDNATGLPITNRPAILSGPATFLPNGQIVVTMNTSGPHTFALMRLGTSTHTVNLDQRRVPLPVSSQSGAQFTLQVPASPAHVPPGLYWLFAMNSAGVPSTGWDLRRG